jgi:hypothetical protein
LFDGKGLARDPKIPSCIIDPSTRRLGPDIAPGLFAFVPLDKRGEHPLLGAKIIHGEVSSHASIWLQIL